MSAVHQPISISKNLRLAPLELALALHVFFKPHYSTFFVFPQKKIGYLDQIFQYKSYFI